LAQRMTEDEIKQSMSMVAEGAYAVRPLYAIAKKQDRKLKTPILDAVYEVLANQQDPQNVFEDLKRKLT